MPNEKTIIDKSYDSSLYPEGLETVPRRFAIINRNKYMLRKSDIVISYVIASYGGAYTACKYAKSQNKIIINLRNPPTHLS